MVMGLLSSGWIALNEWTPFVVGRALLVQSTERRFSRWWSNPRIDVLHRYAVLLRPALEDCPDRRLWVVLDTTVLWNLFYARMANLAGARREVAIFALKFS
jgi:hypothetical protein